VIPEKVFSNNPSKRMAKAAQRATESSELYKLLTNIQASEFEILQVSHRRWDRSIDESKLEGAAIPHWNLVGFLDLPVDYGTVRAGIDQKTVKS
jgi:hypothetical protein